MTHPARPANQSPPLVPFDPLATDPALWPVVTGGDSATDTEAVRALAREVGGADLNEHARLANRDVPRLRAFDRFGERLDWIEYHPSYHTLMASAWRHRIHNLSHGKEGEGAESTRGALTYLWNQCECGVACPISMAHAGLETLARHPEIDPVWVKQLTSPVYDRTWRPIREKDGATLGMTLTERQAGSDLRSVSTRAVPCAVSGPGRPYRLEGHKWFASAPMSDGFLTLAQTEDGPTCFLIPRILDDGSTNPIRILRLKDKLGNRSNASAEVEFHDTIGLLVGEPGRGVRVVMGAAHRTRLDFALGSAGMMRRATLEATHHARHRRAFGSPLHRQPLMSAVLADLALEAEGAFRLGMRIAEARDQPQDPSAAALDRVGTPVAKYWVCQAAPNLVAEALACLGGNGYVEDWDLARFYREAPLNTIWEGASNLVCLDVLRALDREPGCREALAAEIEPARSAGGALADSCRELEALISRGREDEARRLAELTALLMQASLMMRSAPEWVSEAFVSSRFHGPRRTWGSSALGPRTEDIVDRWAHRN